MAVPVNITTQVPTGNGTAQVVAVDINYQAAPTNMTIQVSTRDIINQAAPRIPARPRDFSFNLPVLRKALTRATRKEELWESKDQDHMRQLAETSRSSSGTLLADQRATLLEGRTREDTQASDVLKNKLLDVDHSIGELAREVQYAVSSAERERGRVG